eukprot:g60376.t1
MRGDWEKYNVWNPINSYEGDAPFSFGLDDPQKRGSNLEDPSWAYKGPASSSDGRRERTRSMDRRSRSRSRGDQGTGGRSRYDRDRGGYDRERGSRQRIRSPPRDRDRSSRYPA